MEKKEQIEDKPLTWLDIKNAIAGISDEELSKQPVMFWPVEQGAEEVGFIDVLKEPLYYHEDCSECGMQIMAEWQEQLDEGCFDEYFKLSDLKIALPSGTIMLHGK